LDTRAHSPDSCAPCQQSHSPFAQPCCPPLSRSWAEVICHSSLSAMVPPALPPRCCEEFNGNASSDSVF
jgi:hypothetical protein